ncbi:c-type cytochrome [Conexibacter arvalis]|uniref:Mono/diheme cytochrome c family protein n=1 Tax=Conexibacter arvalis TaxID=912552 RepID=A0A840IF57_9ACTN|nr:cytochrome c [Conexibacter arvalis]MBB4663446.1 mono/diheme cytochrome c family protein [Conexibacter arvalis]
MHLPRMRLLAVAGACGAVLALAACGDDGGGETTSGGGAASSIRTALETTTRPLTTTLPETTTTGPAGSAVLATGREAFDSNGCGSCHTLAAADATGSVGPDLDEVLPGRSAAFIHQSIVDPDAVIAPGFAAGTMPTDFGQRIPRAQLAALVTFLRTQAGR